MKIKILYTFYTDGDYSLRNPENFGCTGREINIEDEYFDYIGEITFENTEIWRCKLDAKSFLEQLLCDGIHISFTHYWLIQSFYNIIEDLINFINNNESGIMSRDISGNQDGTRITVIFIN